MSAGSRNPAATAPDSELHRMSRFRPKSLREAEARGELKERGAHTLEVVEGTIVGGIPNPMTSRSIGSRNPPRRP